MTREQAQENKQYILPAVTTAQMIMMEGGDISIVSPEQREKDDKHIVLTAEAVQEVTGQDAWPQNAIIMTGTQIDQVKNTVANKKKLSGSEPS